SRSQQGESLTPLFPRYLTLPCLRLALSLLLYDPQRERLRDVAPRDGQGTCPPGFGSPARGPPKKVASDFRTLDLCYPHPRREAEVQQRCTRNQRRKAPPMTPLPNTLLH